MRLPLGMAAMLRFGSGIGAVRDEDGEGLENVEFHDQHSDTIVAV